ncbi:hypothetical protein Trydic_g18024 [Trypoxylus dichotomus]
MRSSNILELIEINSRLSNPWYQSFSRNPVGVQCSGCNVNGTPVVCSEYVTLHENIKGKGKYTHQVEVSVGEESI